MGRKERRNVSRSAAGRKVIGATLPTLRKSVKDIKDIKNITELEMEQEMGLPVGYIGRALKGNDFEKITDLSEHLSMTYGLGNIREDFKKWIYSEDMTVSYVSRNLFPEKSDGYLSTMLNPANEDSYPEEAIYKAFKRAKELFGNGVVNETGLLKEWNNQVDDIESKKKKRTKEIAKALVPPADTKNEEPVIGEKNNGVFSLVITNFETKEQTIYNSGSAKLAEIIKFYDCLKKVGGILEGISILPIFENKKTDSAGKH